MKLLDKKEVLENLPNYTEEECFLYFLVLREEIVYVGITIHIDSRIKDHKKDKVFDRVKILKVPRNEAFNIERNYIRTFQPALNINCRKIKELSPSRVLITAEGLKPDYQRFRKLTEYEVSHFFELDF